MQVVVGTAATVGIGLSVVQAPWVYALVVPALISFGILWLVLRWTAAGDADDPAVARWTYLSYILHLGLSLAIGSSKLTVRFFGNDANLYHKDSIALARHWSEGTPKPLLPAGKEGFFYALAQLYELIGPHRVGGLALTSLCSAVLVPLMADTTRRLFGTRARVALIPLIVLLPGFMVWTSQLLREAPIMATLALGTNLAVRISERFSPTYLAMLALTVATLFTLRGNVGYVFAAGLLVGLAVGGHHLVAGVTTSVAMLGLVGTLILGGGLGESGYQSSSKANLQDVNVVRGDLATAKSGIGQGSDVSTTAGSIAYLPIGLPQFLLGPFPWQARNLRQGLGVLDALTLWCLIPALLRGMRRGWRRIGRRSMLLLAPTAGITLVLTLLIGNVGTIVRERLQVLVLLLPFIALGWNREELEAEGTERPTDADRSGRQLAAAFDGTGRSGSPAS